MIISAFLSSQAVAEFRWVVGWAVGGTYLRELLAAPKVVVEVARAGWWCLSAFLTRRVTPPFSEAMTPMACLESACRSQVFFSPGVIHLVGNLALVLAAVDVPQVQRVAGELDAVGPLDEGGAVALGDCPGEVVGDCGGHCVGMGW